MSTAFTDAELESGLKTQKRQQRYTQRALAAANEIPEIPEPVDMDRRNGASLSLAVHCKTYFAETFYLEWSTDHLKAIKHIEHAVHFGGQFALAMPRGSGKTSLMLAACTWALLNGFRKYLMIVCADDDAARKLLESFKTVLQHNQMIYGDYPETCVPLRALIENPRRKLTHKGEVIQMNLLARSIHLPNIAGSAAADAVVETSGITGGIRGAQRMTPDGATIRPDLCLIDDPQTDKVAISENEIQKRERIIGKTILNLAGPNKKIAAMAAVTVIEQDDLADRLLNPELSPEWKSERLQLCYEMPANMELWDEYRDRRIVGLQSGDDGKAATEYYRENREAMDFGCQPAWPERFNDHEISAVQNIMNLYIADPVAFASEYQNEPIGLDDQDEQLTPDKIKTNLNGHERRQPPAQSEVITAFVDVQKAALFWLVVAWREDFTGYVIDYGTWPEQRRNNFTLRDLRQTIQKKYPQHKSIEGQLHVALNDCLNNLMERTFTRVDGAAMQVDRLLIDANWGASTATVRQVARGNVHRSRIRPAHGRYYGAARNPINDTKRTNKPLRKGFQWRQSDIDGQLHVVYCANSWKTFTANRLLTPVGDAKSLSFWGNDAIKHRLLFDHLCCEYRQTVSTDDRTVEEWQQRPNQLDNHWFDCLVGAAVAASFEKISIPEHKPTRRKVKRKSTSTSRRVVKL